MQGWREVLGFLGDIGSPLMCDTTDDDWRLYGVATYNDPECDNTHPSVFTRVSSFRTWINRESGEYKIHLRHVTITYHLFLFPNPKIWGFCIQKISKSATESYRATA